VCDPLVLTAPQKNENFPYSPNIGWAKIAFIHAFRHLLLGTSYVDAIRETLNGGGDTGIFPHFLFYQ
jgi:hypothetical protein